MCIRDRHLLDQYPITPSRLTIEITEEAMIDDPERLAVASLRLKELGVSMSLDDFGGGYSNVSSVRDGNISQLKIDGQWIDDICDDPLSEIIVRGCVEVAHVLELTTVAERVETIEHYEKVKELGVDAIQGYLVSKPKPLHEWVTDANAVDQSNVVPIRPDLAA